MRVCVSVCEEVNDDGTVFYLSFKFDQIRTDEHKYTTIQTEPHNANNKSNFVHFRVQGVLFKFNVKFKVKHHFQAL